MEMSVGFVICSRLNILQSKRKENRPKYWNDLCINHDIIATTSPFRSPVVESQLHDLTSEEVARDSIQTASFHVQALEEGTLSEVAIGYNKLISDFLEALKMVDIAATITLAWPGCILISRKSKTITRDGTVEIIADCLSQDKHEYIEQVLGFY